MKQIISIVLSILLLSSSTGVTYAQHFCGEFEMMAKITLGQERLTCGMQEAVDACGDEKETAHDCCDNEYSQIETDDTFAATDITFIVNPFFVATFISEFILPSQTVIYKEHSSYTYYHPPPLIKDIPVLYESYLI